MATHEPVNFSGSSSNRTAWRRVSSDGGAQLRADNVGGKSPGKIRKFSLFKKTSSKEDLLSGGSGRFERSSGRGKRKTSKGSSSRDSSLDGLSSDNEPRNQTETEGRTSTGAVPGGVAASSSKPPIAKSQARDYAIGDSQELEHRSASELSAKKVQKINKELTKQNNQLNKDVDTLRKENEALQSEKLKLKGENKTLERELRRVSSKGEVQRILKNGPTETDLEEIAAEQRMLERGQKIDALKKKLEKQLEYFRQRDAADKLERMEEDLLPESEKPSSSGGVWDSKTALKRLVEEQDVSSRLQKENMELKSKLAALEADLEQLLKARSSPKNSRIKPGNFFRRSKRGGENQKEKLTVASGDSQRARSPDIPLSELLTFDTPSSLEGTPIHKPLPAHLSPNQSPKLETRDRQNGEIQELKSRVRSAEEDKKSAEKRNKELETELHEVESQLDALQVKVEKGRKDASEEVDKLKKSLKMANSEKTSLSGQIQHLRKELDEIKGARRSAERNTTESLKKKDGRIEELELDCSRVKKEYEKLQKELEPSVAEMKRKDNRIDELEGECSKARKECERLQKELESAKVAIAEAKNEPKVTTPTSIHTTHTAAKPPSGASRHTSPSHSANTSKPSLSVSKTASSTSSPKTASSPVSSTSSPKIASSPVSSTSDSVFVEAAESNSSKVTMSDIRKLSSDSNKSVSESVSSRSTRKSSAESIGEKKPESQPRSRRNSKSPPRLRKRRSSTELIELFEHPPPKETLKPAGTTVKKNTSFANLATSVSHRAKVAATRAMFEGKKDDEPAKTSTAATVILRSESKGGGANRNIYRRTWTGDITQLHRSSHNEPIPTATTIPEGKEAGKLHSKSQSIDAAPKFKSAPSPSPATAMTNTSTSSSASISSSPKHTTLNSTAAPSKPASLNLTSSASSKKGGATVTHQQSVSSTPSSGTPNSSTNLTVTPASTPAGSKVSKITIKSSSASSPSTSPQLNARKEVKEITIGTSMRPEKVTIPVGGQRSRMISSSSTAATPLKSPTTPLKSPNTPLKTPTTPVSVPTTPMKSNATDSNKRTNSVVVTSNGVAKAPSYVPSYVRSNTVSGGESVTSTRVRAAPVTRSQTAVKFTVTTTGSTPTAPQPIRTNIVSPQAAQPEHGILKRGSSLLNTPSDLKKTSSLLDIPENTDEANESSSNNHTSHTSAVGSSNPGTTPSGSSLGVSEKPTAIHRSPVQSRIQRRKREDRPKTMYAGANRSETVSLVRLISKYQEQERKEKGQTNTALSAPASTQVPAVNGNASPTPAAATMFSNSAGSSTSSGSNTNVVTSSRSTPRPRPQSYYGGSSDLIGSGFNTPAAVPAPSNMSSGRKPKKARRSQTVALGGINRTSKKAMLLRWCQIATDHYDNVCINNFGASFSDGLAFCALLHHFIPDQIPYSTLDACNREQNFRIAFEEAEKVGIPRLLDVEDMVALPIPDWMSVMTYITFVYNKFGRTETPVA